MDPDATVSFRRDYGLAQADVAAGVVSSRAAAAVGHWETWCTFCTGLCVDPTLQEYEDPITFLQVFVYRTAMASSPPVAKASDLEQWRMPYAALAKRLRQWGPKTHGSTLSAK